MSFNRKNVVLFLIPLFAVAGCGTDEDTIVKKAEAPPAVETTTPAPEPVEVATPAPQPVVEATYENAENAFLAGRYDEAVELFTRYTGRETQNPWGFYMLGLSAWKDGQLETAETAFQQSIAIDPKHLKSHLNLARVLLESERSSEVLPIVDQALVIDATSSAAYRLKGRACHNLGQSDEAVAAYQAAIRLDPSDAWSMNNLAFIRIQEERYEEALPALARAVELRKDVALFFNNLGMALEHTGRFQAAAEAYASAVAVDASNGKATLNHDRVAAVRDDPAVTPVDLTALARSFESTIETWTVSVATSTPSDSVLTSTPE